MRASARQQAGVAGRVGLGIELAQRLADEHVAARPLVLDLVRLGGHRQQAHVIEARDLLGILDARPQLERALGQIGGLAVGVDRVRRARGGDRAAQRRGLIAGRRVVAGDRRGSLELAVIVGAAALLERARQREVQLAALAGQQVVVQRLAQQRVAEAEAPVVAGDQHLLGDRLAQRGLQRVAAPGR